RGGLGGARSNRDRSSRVAVGGDALGTRVVLDGANGLGKGHAAVNSAFEITREGADRDLQNSAESGSVLFHDEELRPEIDQPDRDGDDDAQKKQRESELSHGEPPLLEERPRPRDHARSLAEASLAPPGAYLCSFHHRGRKFGWPGSEGLGMLTSTSVAVAFPTPLCPTKAASFVTTNPDEAPAAAA